jgi:hypothetical protein
MDPILSINRFNVLSDRHFARSQHDLQLADDRRKVGKVLSNKIKKDPKKSYKRFLNAYKKGKLEKRFLRNHPEYESYAFQKWMRPPDYVP